MLASASLRLPDGSVVTVTEGGLIGRASTAQLRLHAPDISEAHVLISRRGDTLHALALRGRLVRDGEVATEAALEVGTRLGLGRQTELQVVALELPAAGPPPTPPTLPVGAPALSIRLSDGLVRLRAGQGAELCLGGNPADLLRLLAEATSPVHWTTLAAWFWSERDRPRWRQRFDAMLKELRGHLRAHEIRADLIGSFNGEFRLDLGPDDRVHR